MMECDFWTGFGVAMWVAIGILSAAIYVRWREKRLERRRRQCPIDYDEFLRAIQYYNLGYVQWLKDWSEGGYDGP